jgi:hypothetical protein
MESVNGITTIILQVLEVLAALVALFLLLAILASIIKTIPQVIFGKAILVLPLKGSDKGASVSSIFSQQLGEVWKCFLELSQRTINEQSEFTKQLKEPTSSPQKSHRTNKGDNSVSTGKSVIITDHTELDQSMASWEQKVLLEEPFERPVATVSHARSDGFLTPPILNIYENEDFDGQPLDSCFGVCVRSVSV